MSSKQRTNIVLGILLVLLGAWFLAVEFVPGLASWIDLDFAWPFYVIGAGGLLLLIGLLSGTPGMAVPAAIVAGIGALLYWQNATNDWTSWAYAWTLIPGFVGVGVLIAGLLGEDTRKNTREGLRLIAISAVMFVIFGSLLGGNFLLGDYWPVLLILLGVWVLLRPFWRSRFS